MLVFGYGYKGKADFARSIFLVLTGLLLDTNALVGFFPVFLFFFFPFPYFIVMQLQLKGRWREHALTYAKIYLGVSHSCCC